MKKSEIYDIAARSVLTSSNLRPEQKLDVIEELLDRRSTARLTEKMEEEKQNVQ